MNILDKAIKFAVDAHSGMFRKASKIPYIVHPMEAAAIVATMTDDEEIIAGAVLHDVVEDTKYTIEDIEREFGPKIAEYVASESENKREELPEAETWQIRKEETLEHLKNEATFESKMILLGDKLSNIRAIYRDELELGDKLWERFHVKEKERHFWYYNSIAEILKPDFEKFPAWQEYNKLVEEVFKK